MNTIGHFTTTVEGATDGVQFDDTPLHYDKHTAPITKIVIRSESDLLSIEVYYSWNDGLGTVHGTYGSRTDEMTFSAGEYITRVEGRAYEINWLVSLTFITNHGTHGPFGGDGGESFVWDCSDGPTPRPAHRMRLLAFSGYVEGDEYVSGLRAIFCEYPVDLPKTIRYEPRSVLAGPSQTLIPPAVSKSFSSFTYHLMNPTITLYVGEARVQFHVHQDSLCQLPFFQAALTGSFKEASEQVITLPEDNPGDISALIEYLYTGNYTYAYDAETVQLSAGSTAPTADMAEGLFHLGIHVIASKYDCQGLLEIATRHFGCAESELNGIDALRLWKAAYAVDIRFSARTKGPRSAEGLAEWVKVLFTDHREEMEDTFGEYPMMASDILRVSTDSV